MDKKDLVSVTFFFVTFLHLSTANAAVLGTCTDGVRTKLNFRVNVDGSVMDPPAGTVCGAYSNKLIATERALAGIASGAADGGASSGAGALVAGEVASATASSRASIEFEFMVTTVAGTPKPTVPISYEVILTTLRNQGNVSTAGTFGAGGSGSVYVLDEFGVEANVPFEHRTGVPALPTEGSSQSLAGDGVRVVPDTPYLIGISVRTSATAVAHSSETGIGSASAEFSAAVSLAHLGIDPAYLFADDYELHLAVAGIPGATLPGGGVYPALDPPLSLVPIPAALWLFASALGAVLVGVRARKA